MLSILILTILAACELAGAEQKCPVGQFRCLDGNCIKKELKCDGVKHCVDGSDETFKACYRTTCDEKTQFRCSYGACVSADLQCNNIANCWDNSDENKFECALKNGNDIDPLFNELLRGCDPKYAVGCDVDKKMKCLKWSQICDGKRDCADGTDESVDLCAYSDCPLNSFRCENGACINSNGFCNREIDCADGSDEIPDLCRKPIPKIKESNDSDPHNGGVIIGLLPPDEKLSELPEFESNDDSTWTSSGCTLKAVDGIRVVDYFSDYSYKSDAEVPSKTVVSMYCEDGYESWGGAYIKKCIDSQWNSEDFKCVRVCKQNAIERNIRYVTQCIHDSELTNCKENTFIFDTKLLVTCAPGFKPANADSQLGRHSCNETGLWFTEDVNPKCEAICGIKSIHHPDITPWTVSIFQRTSAHEDSYDFKCLGTIISPYVVLTAESCVEDFEGRRVNHTYISVAVGNHSESYTQFEEHGYELHNISNAQIVTHQVIHKAALLTLVKPFKFGATVRPVCFDTSSDHSDSTVFTIDDFREYKQGQGLTIFDDGEYSLTQLVVNNRMIYAVQIFAKSIRNAVTKSELIP
ncbi:modular serine protease-like [Drosophila innubila]|uniref:modular serine protease-like n=1 Tax=Drosophila innubila TaxID=198719 RepID=UPI00148B90F0|nr:modular serine protease-like [Drosophila innubila]